MLNLLARRVAAHQKYIRGWVLGWTWIFDSHISPTPSIILLEGAKCGIWHRFSTTVDVERSGYEMKQYTWNLTNVLGAPMTKFLPQTWYRSLTNFEDYAVQHFFMINGRKIGWMIDNSAADCPIVLTLDMLDCWCIMISEGREILKIHFWANSRWYTARKWTFESQ